MRATHGLVALHGWTQAPAATQVPSEAISCTATPPTMPKKQKHKRVQSSSDAKKRAQNSSDATPSSSISRPALLAAAVCAVAAVGLRTVRLARPEVMPQRLTRTMRVRHARRPVPCKTTSVCGARPCDRVVIDNWLPPAEIDALRDIAARGAAAADATAAAGGPTIVDINSGFVMAPGARLVNLYQSKRKPFGGEDYELYRSVIRRLKAEVEAAFPRASALYFTAPTFLTRLSGENATWEASEPHDEYYQRHAARKSSETTSRRWRLEKLDSSAGGTSTARTRRTTSSRGCSTCRTTTRTSKGASSRMKTGRPSSRGGGA